ncbi:MAG: class I lanthipeptide [Candidatus Omnitrophota bacterium]
MRQKQERKLRLGKITVQNLNRNEQHEVNGGKDDTLMSITASKPDNCANLMSSTTISKPENC